MSEGCDQSLRTKKKNSDTKVDSETSFHWDILEQPLRLGEDEKISKDKFYKLFYTYRSKSIRGNGNPDEDPATVAKNIVSLYRAAISGFVGKGNFAAAQEVSDHYNSWSSVINEVGEFDEDFDILLVTTKRDMDFVTSALSKIKVNSVLEYFLKEKTLSCPGLQRMLSSRIATLDESTYSQMEKQALSPDI